MAHTDEEIDAASRRFEQLVNDFDPAAAVVDNIDELSQVAAASEAVRAGEAKLRESVAIARARGRSWNEIAPGSRRDSTGCSTAIFRQGERLIQIRGAASTDMTELGPSRAAIAIDRSGPAKDCPPATVFRSGKLNVLGKLV
jgi:hypothetical protein